MSDLQLPLSTTSSTFSTSNVEDGENFDRAISNKAPFDFGLDIFTSPSKTTTGLSTSSTQQQQSLLKQSLMHTDTATTSSVSSAQLNFVKPKSTTAATLVGKPDSSSMDSSDVDNGPRPGDWQCPTRGCRNAVPGGCYGSRKHCKLCGARNPNLDTEGSDSPVKLVANVTFENRPITKVAESYFICGKDIYASMASANFRPVKVGMRVRGVMRARANRKDRYPWRAVSVNVAVATPTPSSSSSTVDQLMIESLQAQLVREREKTEALALKIRDLEARQRADAWMIPRLVKLLQEYCTLKNSDFATVVAGHR